MRAPYRLALALMLTGTVFGNSSHSAGPLAKPRVALLELYTSEGCNSCPPADRWVSNLPRPQLVPHRLVVLTFHVDYWNYLGWDDRFAQRRFTERQQALVRANGLRTAYTPQLLLNGRDYRDTDAIDQQVARINREAPRADLALSANIRGTSVHIRAHVQSSGAAASEPMDLYLALYENNLESAVQAGENRGRRLRHDYVVRTLIGPVAVQPDNTLRWEGQMTLAADWKRADLGLAAFVQSRRRGEVFQAAARTLE